MNPPRLFPAMQGCREQRSSFAFIRAAFADSQGRRVQRAGKYGLADLFPTNRLKFREMSDRIERRQFVWKGQGDGFFPGRKSCSPNKERPIIRKREKTFFY